MEAERLKQEFFELYEGSPWIDVTIKGNLSGMSAEKANRRIAAGRNTVWEILNHMIAWRRMVLKRLKGDLISTPQDNFIHKIADPSEDAWKHTLIALEQTQEDWLAFLDEYKDEDLEKICPVSNKSYYCLIQGIIQHDAYHLGQIVLLSKLSY